MRGLRRGRPTLASHRRKFVEHFDRPLSVGLVGGTGFHKQRNPARIGDHMPFTPLFGPIRGIGSGRVPPESARREALSITARERRNEPCFPHRRSNRRCNSGQTSLCVPSRNRRQQVTPLPQPISKGSRFQDKPLLSTKIIPVKQARSVDHPSAKASAWAIVARSLSTAFGVASSTFVRLLAEQESGILAHRYPVLK